MTQFRDHVTLTLTMADLAAIVTEQVCTFNALSDLQVMTVKSFGNGRFELQLAPKVRPAPPKGGQP